MKRKPDNFVGFSAFGLFLFFITMLVNSTISIFVYYLVNKYSNGNILLVAITVLLTVFLTAGLCSLFDINRRKKMIQEPITKILDATEKIASGDFSVKLYPNHEYIKYDSFDLIYENINTMTAELSKNELLKNNFISNVSHEIKTPLTVIQTLAKSLQNSNLSEDKRQEFLNGLILQTNKLANLITNILKLNKLENQEILPEKEKFDLSELVRTSTLSSESLFEKKNLNLECNIDEVTFIGSSSLIEIVLNNLISNAIKFTPQGGTISISLSETDSRVIISVKDTGIGISNEVGKHIFEKFYQGDTSRSSEGNGLGLALVKSVIDIIGGEILVDSTVDVGTMFTISLKKDNE